MLINDFCFISHIHFSFIVMLLFKVLFFYVLFADASAMNPDSLGTRSTYQPQNPSPVFHFDPHLNEPTHSVGQSNVSNHVIATTIPHLVYPVEEVNHDDHLSHTGGNTVFHPKDLHRPNSPFSEIFSSDNNRKEDAGSDLTDVHVEDGSLQVLAVDGIHYPKMLPSRVSMAEEGLEVTGFHFVENEDVSKTTDQRTLEVSLINRIDDDYTLYFEWDAPPIARDSGTKISGIEGYHFEYRVDNSSWSRTTLGLTSSMDYSRVITGRGATFNFRIRARYENDSNESWSNIVTFTTYDVPDAPTNLQAEASGENTINLSWSEPSEDGGLAIQQYRVESSADGTSGWKYEGIRRGAKSTTYSHRLLAPRTTRYYRVIAYNYIGYSEPSNISSATTKFKPVVPSVPTNLSATATSGTQINISWTTPDDDGGADIAGYRIESSLYENMLWSDLVSDTGDDETTYEAMNLKPGSTRFYRVSAINSAGTGEASEKVSATTYSLPDPPTNLTATSSGSTSIILTWRAPSDDGGAPILGYRIDTKIGSAWTTIEANSGLATLSYTVRNLPPSTGRYYRVLAINSVGTGPPSLNVIGFTAPSGGGGVSVPSAPIGLSATASGSNTINLSWRKPDDGGAAIKGYRIEFSTDGGSTFNELEASHSTTTYSHTGLDPSITCVYRVRATNSEGSSLWSDTDSATTGPAPIATAPDAPSGLTANPSGSSRINLSWTAPNNGGAEIEGYRIEVSPDGTANSWTELIASQTAITYSHTGLSPSTTRHYRVRAVNSVGPGAWSTNSATTGPAAPIATAPNAPTALTATSSGSTTINLSWTAPDDGGEAIIGYRIEVSPDGTANSWTELVARQNSTSYSHTGLSPSTTRHYRVRAINSVGTSAWSDTDSATTGPATPTATAPDAPTGLIATASGSTTINLSWTEPDDGGAVITGYRIEVSLDGIAGWTDLESTTSSTITSYDHTNLNPETTRYYRVRAINSVGQSDLSNIANATTEPIVPLSFVTTVEAQFYPVGIAISDCILPEALGGVKPYDYTLTSSLPEGLIFNESTQTISGIPSGITPETMLTWTVEDAVGTITSLKFSLEVYSMSFDKTVENQSYARGQTIPTLILPEAAGGQSPVQYSLNLLELPLGLMFDVLTRSISGTPLVISPQIPFTFKAVDANGALDSLVFTIEVVSPVNTEEQPDVVENFVVHSNYPNPFLHSTQLVFDLPWSAQLQVEVLDLTGRRVYEKPPIHVNAGTGLELELDDLKLPSGSYVYRMMATSHDGGSTEVYVGHFMSVK